MVAAGISDIDDRFSVRIMNLIYTYIGFFITAASVQLLFPLSCFLCNRADCFLYRLDLLGSLRSALCHHCLWLSGGFGLLMLGVHLFEQWYLQPALLVAGAAWYGLLSTISFCYFLCVKLQDQLSALIMRWGAFICQIQSVRCRYDTIKLSAKHD